MEAVEVKSVLNLIPELLDVPYPRIRAAYDNAADVLYLNFKKPSHADDSELTDNDLIIRYEGGPQWGSLYSVQAEGGSDMDTAYFSDRELGPPSRVEEEISPSAWSGILGTIQSRIADNYFAYRYPLGCRDGLGPYGFDESLFYRALESEIPNLSQPLYPQVRCHRRWQSSIL